MKNGITLFAKIAFVFALMNVPVAVQAQEPPNRLSTRSGGEPFVKLDKTRFAVGEDVFFWVGVNSTRKDGTIPKEFQDTCYLVVTRPDGTQKRTHSPWPKRGLTNAGWSGGSGIEEPVVPGTYSLVFEFAGQKSLPIRLTVERTLVLNKVMALFFFDTHGAGDPSVIWMVRNNSKQTIRFPHRDGVNSNVWVDYSGVDNPRNIRTAFPPEKLRDTDETKAPDFRFDTFTWEVARKVRTITLKPGETYRQTLSLNDAVAWARTQSALPPGRYKVTFGTQLQLLIGEPDGKYADISPVRQTVETTAEVTIP